MSRRSLLVLGAVALLDVLVLTPMAYSHGRGSQLVEAMISVPVGLSVMAYYVLRWSTTAAAWQVTRRDL